MGEDCVNIYLIILYEGFCDKRTRNDLDSSITFAVEGHVSTIIVEFVDHIPCAWHVYSYGYTYTFTGVQ